MARTSQEFNQNERRAVELTIDDQDGTTFEPDTAYVTVYDNSDDSEVVGEQDAYVDGSNIYTIIGPAVTANVGEYKIVWRIIKGEGESQYTYYHATILGVVEI